MLHEPLNAEKPQAAVIAQPARHLRLLAERQALLGLARQKMQIAANRPQKGFAAVEGRCLPGGEKAGFSLPLSARIEVDRKPVQHVQVAQAALAFLDVRLDHVPRKADAPQALGAFPELRLDELTLASLNNAGNEAHLHLVEQCAFAMDKPGIEQRGSDRHVVLGCLYGLINRAHDVPDLKTKVPEVMQNGFDDAFGLRRLVGRKKKEQIDI